MLVPAFALTVVLLVEVFKFDGRNSVNVYATRAGRVDMGWDKDV